MTFIFQHTQPLSDPAVSTAVLSY